MGESKTSVAPTGSRGAVVDYRHVFETAPDAILVADDDARYVAANPAACHLFGVSLEDLLGKRVTDFVAAEDIQATEAQWSRFRAERVQSGRFPLRRRDGQLRILEYNAVSDIAPGLHVSILRDVTEYVAGTTGSGTDALAGGERGTWRAALSRALQWEPRTASGRYLATVALIGIATVLQGLVWPILKPLAYFLYFPAVTLATLYGVAWLAIVLSMVVAEFVFVPPTFGLELGKWQNLVRMGVFGLNALLISAISSSLRDWQRRTQRALRQHEAAFDKAGRTIASLAKAEAALKESEARLREQFAQREQFIAMLSHDLRTPLTAAKLAALAARRVRGDEERIAVNSERVVRNIDNADRLIRDLLDASRVGAGQKLPIDPAECDLAAVARSALAELSAVHGERFALHAPAAIQGTWDGNALRRVLENLASNAVKYGEPGTTIDVFLAATDDSVELSVTNRGEPLSADEVQRLFTPYHRSGRAAKSGHAGWGIGLTLVKGVAEAHGGTVSVESSAERGTTFSVRLPREGVLSRSPPPRAP